MKVTAIAPSNIAFIKYWGKKDENLRLPENGSISMCLSNLLTTTTVEFSRDYKDDFIEIDGIKENNIARRVIEHLDRVRKIAGIAEKAKVVSKNNFPTETGLSSSASGFAALTLAGTKAAGLNLSEKELSILTRLGSGSACRSIPNGFVEWISGNSSKTSYTVSIYPPEYWDIVDLVAVVSEEKKEISSTQGQKLIKTSPLFQTRQLLINKKILLIKELIKEKDFEKFGELIEAEALELHAIMLTSSPSLIYWTPGTIKIMKLVKKWRNEGLPVYFTINTGQNIHLICEEKNAKRLEKLVKEVPEVKKLIINKPANGARLTERHLF